MLILNNHSEVPSLYAFPTVHLLLPTLALTVSPQIIISDSNPKEQWTEDGKNYKLARRIRVFPDMC